MMRRTALTGVVTLATALLCVGSMSFPLPVEARMPRPAETVTPYGAQAVRGMRVTYRSAEVLNAEYETFCVSGLWIRDTDWGFRNGTYKVSGNKIEVQPKSDDAFSIELFQAPDGSLFAYRVSDAGRGGPLWISAEPHEDC